MIGLDEKEHGEVDCVEHHIDTGDCHPVSRMVQEMLKSGVIQEFSRHRQVKSRVHPLNVCLGTCL